MDRGRETKPNANMAGLRPQRRNWILGTVQGAWFYAEVGKARDTHHVPCSDGGAVLGAPLEQRTVFGPEGTGWHLGSPASVCWAAQVRG
jgi:hypothetical protein